MAETNSIRFMIGITRDGKVFHIRVPQTDTIEGCALKEEEINYAISCLSEERRRLDPHSEYRNNIYTYVKGLSASLPKKPGIYSIECKANGGIYIGASRDIRQRIKGHVTRLSDPKDCIGCDVKRYGIENFTFSVLELVKNPANLSSVEESWFLKYQMEGVALYNRDYKFIEHRAWRDS
jgi:hypothetical protein